MDDPSIDAVTIATCNHWHALAGIWACQAGKHVYVEKPIAHNVWEGRKLVEAARKYDRIVQGGNQSPLQRFLPQGGPTGPGRGDRPGLLGGAANSPGPGTRWASRLPSRPPSWLDWDLWLGTGAGAAFPPEPGALQLALVLGTSATGRWGTTGSTSSTSAAGSWARTSRSGPTRREAVSGRRTRPKPPIRTGPPSSSRTGLFSPAICAISTRTMAASYPGAPSILSPGCSGWPSSLGTCTAPKATST